jgi:uncharacterized RDD family membrane protein YckC
MKIFFRPWLAAPVIALWLTLSVAALAQPAPAAPTPANDDDKSKLRRLDEAPADRAPATPAPKSRAQQQRERAAASKERSRERADARTGTEVFNLFGHATLKAGKKADVVVAIFGSATAEGEVMDSVVSVFGANRATGEVHGDVVAVFGNAYVNCPVEKDVVVVFGNLELGPEARVNGEVVCVGGTITRDPTAAVARGTTNILSINTEWLTGWFEQCLLKARPLAFDRRVGWAWAAAFSFLLFYVLLALLFPKAVVTCAENLENQPGYSLLASVLTVLLTPVAVVVLAITVVGAVLIPFFGAALMLAGLFGRAVVLAWLGRRVTKFFGDGPLGHPVFAVLVGGLITLMLYTIPFAGFLLFKLIGWLGLGVVIYTITLAIQREKKARAVPVAATVSLPPPPIAPAPASPVSPTAEGPGLSRGFVGAGIVAAEAVADARPTPPPLVTPSPPVAAPLRSAPPPAAPPLQPITWERAGFFIRLGALAIDGLLIGMIASFISSSLPRVLNFGHEPSGLLLALAIYGAVMWKLKGTTIGGIVCGLKVVRLDQREIDWPTAIVRALACFLSLMVAGLGFLWVAFDDERQSWHDKIAGTTVVRAPKGTSLV